MADLTSAVGASSENFFVSSTEERAEAEAADRERVSQDEFLLLLTKQLTNQDPLEPVDNQEFLGQIAQMQALDEQIDATKAMVGMRLDSQLRAGNEFIGKTISGIDKNNNDAAGKVKSVLLSDEQIYLQLENLQRVPFDKVTSISE